MVACRVNRKRQHRYHDLQPLTAVAAAAAADACTMSASAFISSGGGENFSFLRVDDTHSGYADCGADARAVLVCSGESSGVSSGESSGACSLVELLLLLLLLLLVAVGSGRRRWCGGGVKL